MCVPVARQLSVWLTGIKETGAGAICESVCPLRDVRAPVLRGQPPTMRGGLLLTRMHTHIYTHGLKEHRRELSVCITAPVADKGEPRAVGIMVLLCAPTPHT